MVLVIVLVSLAAVLTVLTVVYCRRANARIDRILTEELGPAGVRTHTAGRVEERTASTPVARADLARFGRA
jgi:hypothetical protein